MEEFDKNNCSEPFRGHTLERPTYANAIIRVLLSIIPFTPARLRSFIMNPYHKPAKLKLVALIILHKGLSSVLMPALYSRGEKSRISVIYLLEIASNLASESLAVHN